MRFRTVTHAAAPTRRSVLAVGAGVGATALLTAAGAPDAGASDAVASARHTDIGRRLRALEGEYEARLGVFALDTATGRTVAHRAGERFPMCSVFKALAVGAVLRDLDHHGEFLARRIHYTERYVRKSGYAPVTGRRENVERGMTVSELCAAALGESDNGAGNLLLRELGGPTAVTRFARSLGDTSTRLDRWEPELNSAEPWRETDTTTPRAIGTTLGRLLTGSALPRPDRKLLTGWMVANTTNTERFRAGLPADWTLADKTGSGAGYGVANDAGVVTPPDGAPLILSVLSTKPEAPEGAYEDALVARAARLTAAAVLR